MRSYMEELRDRAVEEIIDRTLELYEAMKDRNGLVYGDESLNNPEDFVMFYIDLRDRGVLDNLRIVNADFAADLDERFERDAQLVMIGNV